MCVFGCIGVCFVSRSLSLSFSLSLYPCVKRERERESVCVYERRAGQGGRIRVKDDKSES